MAEECFSAQGSAVVQDIFIYLEIFYNRKQRHVGLGYVLSDQFEHEYDRKQKLAVCYLYSISSTKELKMFSVVSIVVEGL